MIEYNLKSIFQDKIPFALLSKIIKLYIKVITFTFIIITMMFASCNNSSSERIKTKSPRLPYQIQIEKNLTNLKSIPLSGIGQKIEYIPLETNPNCLIGSIGFPGLSNSRIIFSDSLIFISDGEKLLQFNNYGKFIRQIGSKGRGPQDHQGVFDFCIYEEKKLIYILSARIILEYDYVGQFIRLSKLPFLSIQFMQMDTNKFIFYLPNAPVKSNDTIYSYYITNKRGNPFFKYINYHKRVNTSGPRIGWSALYSFKETCHFMEFGTDTLLALTSTIPEPYAIMHLGSMKINPDPISFNSKENIDFMNKKHWIRFINENNKNLFIVLWWGFSDSSKYCVFNKLTHETFTSSNNGFINDLDGGPPFWPKYIYNDSILVDFIEAHKLLNIIKANRSKKLNEQETKNQNFLEQLGKQLSETSNPVLLIVKE